MAGSKMPVTIDRVGVAKIWEKSAKKSVTDAAQKALEKALKGVSGLEYVKSIKKTDKGVGMSVNFVDIAHNAKKNVLTLKMEVLVTKYPGPRIVSSGSSTKIEATKIDAKAALKRAPLLAGDLVAAKMPKVSKVLQAVAKSL